MERDPKSVLDAVLDGGVNDALNLDSHGKALSFHLLQLLIVLPRGLMPLLKQPSEHSRRPA